MSTFQPGNFAVWGSEGVKRQSASQSIIGRSCLKSHFCRDKHLLSRQKYACRDRTFVTTKYFCRDKRVFFATSIFLSRKKTCFINKSKLVATKVLSRQNYVCRDKTFVATKIILVAAPAMDKREDGEQGRCCFSAILICCSFWSDSPYRFLLSKQTQLF